MTAYYYNNTLHASHCYNTENISIIHQYCWREVGQGPVHTASSAQQRQINSHSTHTCGYGSFHLIATFLGLGHLLFCTLRVEGDCPRLHNDHKELILGVVSTLKKTIALAIVSCVVCSWLAWRGSWAAMDGCCNAAYASHASIWVWLCSRLQNLSFAFFQLLNPVEMNALSVFVLKVSKCFETVARQQKQNTFSVTHNMSANCVQ